jgi:hypothetical protein
MILMIMYDLQTWPIVLNLNVIIYNINSQIILSISQYLDTDIITRWDQRTHILLTDINTRWDQRTLILDTDINTRWDQRTHILDTDIITRWDQRTHILDTDIITRWDQRTHVQTTDNYWRVSCSVYLCNKSIYRTHHHWQWSEFDISIENTTTIIKPATI